MMHGSEATRHNIGCRGEYSRGQFETQEAVLCIDGDEVLCSRSQNQQGSQEMKQTLQTMRD